MQRLPERDRPPIKVSDAPGVVGMLEAEKQFRKVIGHTDLARLAVAIERRLHLQQPNPVTTQEPTIAVTV